MGNREQSTLKSDSGYGDDASVSSHTSTQNHPLARKGYEIGPASGLQIGDVFEFLWADAPEFEWEWKCLGYTRFIVLRHSDTFPHHCACIPISVGGKHEFAKPGIDSFQQGFVFANGDRNPGCEQPGGGPKLPYSPVGIELRPGRLRVKEDSRANYADIVEIDHDAQVMVVGDVAMYFDRVRRNVNRAFMRQILRKALDEYRQNGKNPVIGSGSGNTIPAIPENIAAASSVGAPPGAPPVPVHVPTAASRSGSTITPAREAMSTLQATSSLDPRSTPPPTHERSDSEPEMMTFEQQLQLLHYLQRHNAQQQQERQQMQQQQQVSSSSRPPSRAMSTMSTMSSKERSRERPDSRRTSRSIHSSHPSGSGHRRRHSSTTNVHNPKMVESRPMRGVTGPGAGPPPGPGDSQSNGSTTNNHGYDVKSMHNVAMAGLK